MAVRIVNGLILAIVVTAMVGVDVCRIYCSPCGESAFFVNAVPSENSCSCGMCGTTSCCKNVAVVCPDYFYSCEKSGSEAIHHHPGLKHVFYKILNTYQGEESTLIPLVAVLPFEIALPLEEEEYTLRQHFLLRDTLIKAPPLEFLCTYRC